MHKLTLLLPAAALLAVSACSPGYYDNQGNFVDGGNSQDSMAKTKSTEDGHRFDNSQYQYHDHNEDYRNAPTGSAVAQSTTVVDANGDVTRTTTVTTYYDRAGYYDAGGNYVAAANAPRVPHSMWPTRGSCRIWYPDRTTHDQPPVEACDGIQNRVPDGAYVIYGG